jgi:hypothetical protein
LAKNRTGIKGQEQAPDDENIKQRLDMFDQRLDNIDSMVSAVIERVMNQPISVGITCPHCGKSIEIALIGNRRPRV